MKSPAHLTAFYKLSSQSTYDTRPLIQGICFMKFPIDFQQYVGMIDRKRTVKVENLPNALDPAM